LRGLEYTQHPFSNFRCNPFDFAQGKCLQSRNQVSQKAGGVVIPFAQRKPSSRSLAIGDPFAEQGGFTKTGRGRDKGQLAMETLVQPLDQARAGDEFGSGGGI
jgi:hypothetical protein